MNIFSFVGPVVFAETTQFCLCSANVAIDTVQMNGCGCVVVQLFFFFFFFTKTGHSRIWSVPTLDSAWGDSLFEAFLEVPANCSCISLILCLALTLFRLAWYLSSRIMLFWGTEGPRDGDVFHLIYLIWVSFPPSTMTSLAIPWFLKHTVLPVFDHAIPPVSPWLISSYFGIRS